MCFYPCAVCGRLLHCQSKSVLGLLPWGDGCLMLFWCKVLFLGQGGAVLCRVTTTTHHGLQIQPQQCLLSLLRCRGQMDSARRVSTK